MDKTETNIAIAKIAVDLLQIMNSPRYNLPFSGISDEITPSVSSPMEVYQAIYARLKKELIEER